MKRTDLFPTMPGANRLPDLDATRRSILERVVTQPHSVVRQSQQPDAKLDPPRTK